MKRGTTALALLLGLAAFGCAPAKTRNARENSRSHYEIVVGYNRQSRRLLLMDPAEGWRENSLNGFEAAWQPTQRVTLVVFEPA